LDQESAVKALVELGLLPIDAQVYLMLVTKGSKKGKELLTALKINRQQLYRSLKNLQSKGIVSSTLERPSRFSTIPPEQIVDMAIKNKSDETAKLIQRRMDILSILQSAEVRENTDPTARFTVVEGENFIFTKIGQMIKDAKNQVWVTVSGLSVIQAEKADMIKTMIELNVPFRILTNVSAKNLSIIENTVGKVGASSKYYGRHIDLEENLFPRFVIRDNEEMIFLISKEGGDSAHKNDTGLWTNSKPLINAFKTFFEELWHDAEDIDKRILELKTGETLPKSMFIREAEDAYQRFLSIISSAQNEIILITSAKGLEDMLSIKKTLASLKNRNIAVRIMAPIDRKNENAARQLSDYCNIRHVQLNYLGEVVADGKQLLHFKAAIKESSLPSACFANSFYTNDPEYVQGRKELLDELWNNSPSAIAELKRSEARFRSLYENSFDAILLTLPDGSTLSANPSARRMFGMSEDEFRKGGKSAVLVLDQKARNAIYDREKRGKAVAELTLKRKDGSTFEAETTSSLFKDADGATKRSIIIRDITERKKAQEAIKRSKERITDILASIDEYVYSLDRDWNFIYVSNKSASDWNLKTEELIGKNYWQTFPVFAGTEVEKNFRDAMSKREVKHFEWRTIYNPGYREFSVFPSAEGITVYGKDITERKRAEKRFETIIATATDCFWILDKQGRFLEVNEAYCRLTGYTRKELLSMRIADVEAIETPEETAKHIQQVIEKGSGSFETPHKCKDGRVVYLDHSFNYLKEEDGGRFFVFARDLTERKKTEEALRRGEIWRATSFYTRNLIEASLDPLVTISADGKITDVNRATEQITECSRDHLVGSDFSDFFTEPEKARTVYQKVFEWGFVKDYPLAIRSMSGRITAVLYNAVLFKNESGVIQGVFASARDMTELIKAERTLDRKQKELNCILDSSPTIIFYKDMDGKFIQANRAFGEALKIPSENLLGKTVFDIYSKEIAQGMTNDDAAVLESRRPKLGIVEPYESPNGLGWIRTDKIPSFDEKGVLIGLIGFSEDITERKTAEEALVLASRRSNEILDSIQESFCEIDRDWNFVYINRHVKVPQGFENKDLIGQSLWKIFPNLKGTVYEENFRVTMEKRELRRFEAQDEYLDVKHAVTVFPSAVGISVLTTNIKNERK